MKDGWKSPHCFLKLKQTPHCYCDRSWNRLWSLEKCHVAHLYFWRNRIIGFTIRSVGSKNITKLSATITWTSWFQEEIHKRWPNPAWPGPMTPGGIIEKILKKAGSILQWAAPSRVQVKYFEPPETRGDEWFPFPFHGFQMKPLDMLWLLWESLDQKGLKGDFCLYHNA